MIAPPTEAIQEAPRDRKVTPRRPVLEGKHLSCVFGEGESQVTALADVSIDLYSGEFTLILGPSGAGKSTLLAVLSGLLCPTSGRVLALGRDLYQMSEREREHFRLLHCGFIFQDYNLLPSLNARQQLEIILRWGKGTAADEARARAEKMLSLLGLANKTKLMPHELSGGEQQRVAIGRGLVKNPALCFADEPTGALDWGRGEQVVDLLRTQARERGVAVLTVAHDERIAPYADRVLFMEDGRLHEMTPGRRPA